MYGSSAPIDRGWLQAATADASVGQIAPSGCSEVPDAVERMDALLRSWAVGFAARRDDVRTSEFRPSRRGWHDDECAAFLGALDARLVHVDSAGYAYPLAASPKVKRGSYALCWKWDPGVGVNLEYLIQLAVACELHSFHGWPADQIHVERGEFDAEVLAAHGQVIIEMEAKCRVRGLDSLERLLGRWLDLAEGAEADPKANADRKYAQLLDRTGDGSVRVLLVAAGARWWMDAHQAHDANHGHGRIVFTEAGALSAG